MQASFSAYLITTQAALWLYWKGVCGNATEATSDKQKHGHCVGVCCFAVQSKEHLGRVSDYVNLLDMRIQMLAVNLL